MTDSHDATLKRFEDALAAPDETFYDLTLFVSGASDLAARAINNTRSLCDLHMGGRYHLAVVDVHDDRDGTAVADEDDRLSPGDEGDEGLGGRVQELDAAAVLTGPLLPAPLAGLTGLPSPPGPRRHRRGTPRQADHHHDSPAPNPVRHPARRGLGHLT